MKIEPMKNIKQSKVKVKIDRKRGRKAFDNDLRDKRNNKRVDQLVSFVNDEKEDY